MLFIVDDFHSFYDSKTFPVNIKSEFISDVPWWFCASVRRTVSRKQYYMLDTYTLTEPGAQIPCKRHTKLVDALKAGMVVTLVVHTIRTVEPVLQRDEMLDDRKIK